MTLLREKSRATNHQAWCAGIGGGLCTCDEQPQVDQVTAGFTLDDREAVNDLISHLLTQLTAKEAQLAGLQAQMGQVRRETVEECCKELEAEADCDDLPFKSREHAKGFREGLVHGVAALRAKETEEK